MGPADKAAIGIVALMRGAYVKVTIKGSAGRDIHCRVSLVYAVPPAAGLVSTPEAAGRNNPHAQHQRNVKRGLASSPPLRSRSPPRACTPSRSRFQDEGERPRAVFGGVWRCFAWACMGFARVMSHHTLRTHRKGPAHTRCSWRPTSPSPSAVPALPRPRCTVSRGRRAPARHALPERHRIAVPSAKDRRL